jgi:hypothetical protein
MAPSRLRYAPRLSIFGTCPILGEEGLRGKTKGKIMTTILNRLRARLHEQARYRAIRDEIARMPLDVALDLDIYPGDAERIAHKAVWG